VKPVHKSLQISVQISGMLYISTEWCRVYCNTAGVLGSWHWFYISGTYYSAAVVCWGQGTVADGRW